MSERAQMGRPRIGIRERATRTIRARATRAIRGYAAQLGATTTIPATVPVPATTQTRKD